MPFESLLKTLDDFLKIPAVTGFEDPFLNVLNEKFQALGCTTEHYPRALWVEQGDLHKEDFILTSHIDRNGFVTTTEGLLYSPLYWRDRTEDKEGYSTNILNRLKKGFANEEIFAYDPKTGECIKEGQLGEAFIDDVSKTLRFSCSQFDDLPPHLPVALKSHVQAHGQLVFSQIDNAICVAMAYELFRQGWQGAMLFAGSEEIAHSAEYILHVLNEKGLHDQRLLVLDTTPYEDEQIIHDGPVILRTRDARAEFDAELSQHLRRFCERHSIPYRVKNEDIESWNDSVPQHMEKKHLGKTELGSIIEISEGRVNGSTIQIPTFHYHTNYETTSFPAIENMWKTLCCVTRMKNCEED